MSNGFGLKPDLVVISRSNKRIAWLELTCPLERNICTANTYKHDKYSCMGGDLEDKRWKVYLMPYEVNSRGQILKSTKCLIITTLKQFKIKIKAEQLMFKQLSKIAQFHFSMLIKPRNGFQPPSSNLNWSWNQLAVGNGFPHTPLLHHHYSAWFETQSQVK